MYWPAPYRKSVTHISFLNVCSNTGYCGWFKLEVESGTAHTRIQEVRSCCRSRTVWCSSAAQPSLHVTGHQGRIYWCIYLMAAHWLLITVSCGVWEGSPNLWTWGCGLSKGAWLHTYKRLESVANLWWCWASMRILCVYPAPIPVWYWLMAVHLCVLFIVLHCLTCFMQKVSGFNAVDKMAVGTTAPMCHPVCDSWWEMLCITILG